MGQAFQLSSWEKKEAARRARENQRRQNERMHNDKKNQAAQEAKQAAEGLRLPRDFHTGNGETYDEVLIGGGGGMCGVLVGVGVGMLKEGMPIDVVRDAVYGDLSTDVIAGVMDLRHKVVERSRGHALCVSLDNYDEEKQGKELPPEQAYNNGHYAIKGRNLWEEVSGRKDGWVDDIFRSLESEEIGVFAEIEIAAWDEEGTPVNAKKDCF